MANGSVNGATLGFENKLWRVADALRSSMDASEYKRAELGARQAEGANRGLPKPVIDFFPSAFEESALGEIPKGWRVSSVGDEFNITMGQLPPGETYNETGDGIAFYQGRADFQGRFPKRRVYCTAPTRLARAGDTLVSVRAPVGDINMAAEDCAIGRGVAAARHKSGSRSYTYQFMHTLEAVFSRVEAEGTVFSSISKTDFCGMFCIAPSSQLISSFETILGPVTIVLRPLKLNPVPSPASETHCCQSSFQASFV